MTLGVQVRLLIYWHEYVQQCYEVYAYVTQWSTRWLRCTQMTLGISMLNNVFLLHTKCKTIISSIPMYYTKCHNVFSPNKVTYDDK